MDTLMAILAGCVVLPSCAAFGLNPAAGPSLLFVSMQTVFLKMGGFIGSLMGFLFYFLTFLAALSSSISILEVCTAYSVDKNLAAGKGGKDGGRKKATVIFAVAIFVFGLLVALDGIGAGKNGGAAIGTPAEVLGMSWKEADVSNGFGDGKYYELGTDGKYTSVDTVKALTPDAGTQYYVSYWGTYREADVSTGFDVSQTYFTKDGDNYTEVTTTEAVAPVAGTTYYKSAVKGWNDCWLDFYDMISEGILMPLGALMMSLLIGWKFKTDMVLEECEADGKKSWGRGFFDVCYKFITPLGMLVVLYGQITSFFG
jgi:SNF family Na+-dependent transporter